MNTLMVAIILAGVFSFGVMRRESFPEFELEIILVSVPYPGAAPAVTEEGICQKIEEAVRAVDGIKKMTSVAKEGSGNVILELRSDVDDVQKIVNEVRSEVDRIPSFPDLAEDTEVQQITMRWPAMSTSVTTLLSPGSNRTEEPEGTFRRLPYAKPRSNTSAAFVSRKW